MGVLFTYDFTSGNPDRTPADLIANYPAAAEQQFGVYTLAEPKGLMYLNHVGGVGGPFWAYWNSWGFTPLYALEVKTTLRGYAGVGTPDYSNRNYLTVLSSISSTKFSGFYIELYKYNGVDSFFLNYTVNSKEDSGANFNNKNITSLLSGLEAEIKTIYVYEANKIFLYINGIFIDEIQMLVNGLGAQSHFPLWVNNRTGGTELFVRSIQIQEYILDSFTETGNAFSLTDSEPSMVADAVRDLNSASTRRVKFQGAQFQARKI